jgi:EamA domain-containing membrane protein RarD
MLASLIAAFVSGEAANAARRAKGAVIAYVVVAILALTGIGFLVGAAYVVAARRFGSVEAAIGFGVAFILIALLILLVRKIAASMRARRSRRRAVDIATIAGAAAVSALPLLLRKGGASGLVVPLIAIAAYAIYREHKKDDPDPGQGEG